MSRTFTFQPLIPTALWVFLALGWLAVSVWYGWRRPGSIARRRWAAILTLTGLGSAGALAILLNPTWLERVEPPGGKPLLTVLVDTSASMATPDSAAGKTRYESATELASVFAQKLRDRYDVRVVTFAGSTKAVEPDALPGIRPEGPTTDLAVAIAESLDHSRPQGQAIVLLSDGSHNAGGQAARVLDAVRLARGLDSPIYTKTLGGNAEVSDLDLQLQSQQELAFLGQQAPLIARVRKRGLGVPGATVMLSFEGKEVARQQVTFEGKDSAETRFDVQQPKRGLYRYEASLEPAPGEVSLVNNAETFLLQVVDQPIHVLLLEGKPYWDAKFLMRTLGTDASIELESVVRLSEGRFFRRSLRRSTPRSGEAPQATEAVRQDEWEVLKKPEDLATGPGGLRRYQIIVLGRDADVFLDEATLGRIKAWVAQDGGALVCYRGAPAARISQPLARLLPVRWSQARESRFRVQLTERGQDLRWLPTSKGSAQSEMLATLPTLARNEQPQEPKPLAVVLATSTPAVGSEPIPVVTYQPYGSGRVVVIEGAGMWRWAFLPPESRGNDGVYDGLWHSLMRWLATGSELPPGQEVALRIDKVGFQTTEPVTATLLVRHESAGREIPSVELTGDSQKAPKAITPVPTGDEPGMFRVLFGTLPEDRYQARVAGRDESSAQVAFDVREPVEEKLNLAARPDLMARIAQESGASVLASASPRELIDQFQDYQARGRTERVMRYPAWDRWWVLAAILAAWSASWKLRRSSGLV
jgi:hypothetical protein